MGRPSAAKRREQRLQDQGAPSAKRHKSQQEDPWTLGILAAAWRNQPGMACHYLDAMQDVGMQPGPGAYASFLQVCSQGNDWETAARGGKTPNIVPSQKCAQEPPGYPTTPPGLVDPSPTDMLARGEALFAAMQRNSILINEAAYRGMARIACIKGNAQQALEHARASRQLVEQQAQPHQGAGQQAIRVKMRTYHPVLVACAVLGDSVIAAAAEKELLLAGLELTEYEVALLLEAAIGSGTTERLTLLLRLPRETRLQDSTLSIVERLVTAPQQDVRSWTVLRNTAPPAADGYLAAAGDKVKRMEPDAEDWEAFSAALGILAAAKEQPLGAFHSFQHWLRAHGPFTVVVDGINVAYSSQATKRPTFLSGQLACLLSTLAQQRPGERILLVLPANQRATWEQRRGNSIISTYYVPGGSNDDWYWMYAAVQARNSGTAVTMTA